MDDYGITGTQTPESSGLDGRYETKRIQQAIEKIADEENSDLAHIKELSSSVTESAPPEQEQEPVLAQSTVGSWFITFMCMNLPVIGWIYLLCLAFSKKKPDRRNFARAYLFYKLVFLFVGIIILWTLARISMNILEQFLDYMEML